MGGFERLDFTCATTGNGGGTGLEDDKGIGGREPKLFGGAAAATPLGIVSGGGGAAITTGGTAPVVAAAAGALGGVIFGFNLNFPASAGLAANEGSEKSAGASAGGALGMKN